MPVRLIKKTWYVDFYFDKERCRRRSPLNTRPGAIAYELFIKKEATVYGSVGAALRANTPGNRLPCPTFQAFAPRWISGYVVVNNRPAEQKHKRTILDWHLLPHFGHQRMCDIGMEDIERYKGIKRQEGFAPKTINNHLAVLHRCLNCAKSWNILKTEIPRVPLLKSPEPAFHFLTPDDCEKLVATAPQGVWRTIILMGLRTGLRFCELAALKWDDVDLLRSSVAVRRSVVGGHISPPKNNRTRHVPLTAETVKALSELPRSRDWVFQQDGNPLGYNVAWRVIDKLSESAGIDHVSWHDLRHTFASQLVERGASLLSVQKLLGHSDIQVTMRYSHLGKNALRDAIALLEPAPVKELQLAA